MTDATSEIKKAMALGTDQEQGAALRQVGSPWSREARLPRGRTAPQFEMPSSDPQRGEFVPYCWQKRRVLCWHLPRPPAR